MIDASHLNPPANPAGSRSGGRPVLSSTGRLAALSWLILIVVLSGWTAWHLGALDLSRTVTDPNGAPTVVPNTLASVDHPYHASRAATLLDTIRDGNLLRWVGSHEGGYPVEFYPLGVPWLTVVVWALLFGTVSILAAYKLVVIGLLLAPVLAFGALGRTGRVALPTAAIGLIMHLAVPAGSWAGGYTELVVWGLVTNVAGYVAALGFLAALAALLSSPSRWAFVATVVLGVVAVGCNTRSTIALLAATAGVLVAILSGRDGGWHAVLVALRRTLLAGGIALLLSAPILLNSLRFSDQYEFIRYSWYDGISDYLGASVDAVSWPVAVAGSVGLLLGLLGIGSLADRGVAWTLVFYVVLTSILGGLTQEGGLVGQLEATRLMPFQRLLLIYLAATAVVWLAHLLARGVKAGTTVFSSAAIAAALVAVLIIVAPIDAIPEGNRPIPVQQLTGSREYVELEAAVALANEVAPPGTALLIAGSELGWHQPMWAPAMTERPLHYDNWLWLWQSRHRMDPIRYEGQAIEPASYGTMLSTEYLARNGIGAVIALTPQVREIADVSPALLGTSSGRYAVYLVRGEPGIVSGPPGTAVASTWHGGQRITATATGEGGNLVVHQTWFPRWQATVNGEPAELTAGPDGQIRLTVPAGVADVVLWYGTDRWDWLFRAMAAVGLVLLVIATISRRVLGVAPAKPRGSGQESSPMTAKADPYP